MNLSNNPGSGAALPTFGTLSTGTGGVPPSFGVAPAATSAPAFGFGITPQAAPGAATFGSTGFGTLPQFGTANKAATTTAPGLSFGAPKTTSAAPAATGISGFNLGVAAPIPGATTTAAGFAASATTSSAPSFSLTSTSIATTGPTGFSLGTSLPGSTSANLTSTTSSGFSVTTPASSGFSLGLALPTTAAPASTFSLGSTAVSAAATTAAADTSGAAAAKSSVNFAQLDDTIQKWTLELVELEQVFLNQMDQVRDWDRLLLTSGDKIVALNDGMQKVKLRQQQLDHELDFIVAQQRELVECLVPLEKEFADINVSDPERNSVYQRAENLNTQLQQVSEDLKGVIEHINERNRSQDTSDPIVQIGRILNAHMNSLQWVDQNTAVIQQMLDQVGKMRDIHRRDADSTQNL